MITLFGQLCIRRVMKRVVTLINQLATVSCTTAEFQVQADKANQTAKKYMEDNELLKQVECQTGSVTTL